MAIELYDNDTDNHLGSIPHAQLRVLQRTLEEESDEDQDYWINSTTIDLLKENGAHQDLVNLLREALGERRGFEVRWEED